MSIQRIAELSADHLIGTDEGTHGGPDTVRVYERIDGTRYARHYHANSSYGTEPVEGRDIDSENPSGRMRWFCVASAMNRRAEIERLRDGAESERQAAIAANDLASAREFRGRAARDEEAAHRAFAVLNVPAQRCRIDWFGDTTAHVTIGDHRVIIEMPS